MRGHGDQVAVGAAEFAGRHAYFADPEENYWEVVYLSGGGPGQQAVDRALGAP